MTAKEIDDIFSPIDTRKRTKNTARTGLNILIRSSDTAKLDVVRPAINAPKAGLSPR